MNQNKNNTVVAKTAGHREVMVHREERTFAGPIPHPELLAQYEQIVPGAGERILRMAEKQSDHRQDMERQVIQSDIANSRRGTDPWISCCVGLCRGVGIYSENGASVRGF